MAKADSRKLLSCGNENTGRSNSSIFVDACKLLLNDETEEDGISLDSCAITSIYSSSSSSLTSTDDNDITESPTSSSTSVIKSSNADSVDRTDLWWIHGNGYDLKEFVHNHPGGVEAILLGKGRDCTALVESYHPFSEDRVWKILEKYYCHTQANNDEEKELEEKKSAVQKVATTTSDTMTETYQKQQQRRGRGRVPDFFYEILKKRVVNALKSKGIDAIHDRGASPIRIVYYLMVFILWSYSGYLHCSVRFVCLIFMFPFSFLYVCNEILFSTTIMYNSDLGPLLSIYISIRWDLLCNHNYKPICRRVYGDLLHLLLRDG